MLRWVEVRGGAEAVNMRNTKQAQISGTRARKTPPPGEVMFLMSQRQHLDGYIETDWVPISHTFDNPVGTISLLHSRDSPSPR